MNLIVYTAPLLICPSLVQGFASRLIDHITYVSPGLVPDRPRTAWNGINVEFGISGISQHSPTPIPGRTDFANFLVKMPSADPEKIGA